MPECANEDRPAFAIRRACLLQPLLVLDMMIPAAAGMAALAADLKGPFILPAKFLIIDLKRFHLAPLPFCLRRLGCPLPFW